jgi:hypothetical protein
MSEPKQTINEIEIAEQFMSQYEAFYNNNMVGTVFTDDQMGAMIRAIKARPDEMCIFFSNVGTRIIGVVFEDTGDWEQVQTVYSHYNSVLVSLLVRVLHIWSAKEDGVYAPPVSPQYTNDHDTLFANLDFKLPDWGSLGE